MISHIVSAFSGKPIFGQDGPKYLYDILKQTICRKIFFVYKQNTIQISHSHILYFTFLFIKMSLQLFLWVNEKKDIFFVHFKRNCFFKVKIYWSQIISACIIYYLKVLVMVFTAHSAIVLVKIFVLFYYPQITEARILFKIYKSNIKINSGLSMLVGISEAIRLLFFKSLTFILIELCFLINNKILYCFENFNNFNLSPPAESHILFTL